MRVHRDYNYCFVSSSNIARFYAEGFGIAVEKVLPYGVPRTDMFFDQSVSLEKRRQLYDEYPALKDKKVILFLGENKDVYIIAKNTDWKCYCTEEQFDIDSFLKDIGE